MTRISKLLVTTLGALISLSTTSAFAAGKDITAQELSDGLTMKLKLTYASEREVSDAMDLDVAFGFEAGGVRVSFNAEEATCKILAPESTGYTLYYENSIDQAPNNTVLVLARQYANALLIGENITLDKYNSQVLGSLGKVPTNSSINSWKDIGYDVVLVKTKLPDSVKAIKASRLHCK